MHEENERSRRDLRLDFYDESSYLVKVTQDNDLNDNNVTNIYSVSVNRSPTSDNELVNKKCLDDELDKNTVLRYNQTLENYLKVSVGKITYNLTKYNKTQLTDTTVIKYPFSGGYLVSGWRMFCNDKNNKGKIQKLIRSTKTKSPSSPAGATSLPTVGHAFMYIETSSNNHGKNVFVILKELILFRLLI